MSGTWFIADLHFSHERVAELRGHTTHEHDRQIIFRWHKQVKPNDQVWVLGDISSGGADAQKSALHILGNLPGRKRLIAGNHDSSHPMHMNASWGRWDKEYRKVFEWVGVAAQIRIDGHKVMLSHFPYEADHTETARYPDWRLPNTGRYLIHGHTHQTHLHTSRQELCVSWDVYKRLINHGEIREAIRSTIQ